MVRVAGYSASSISIQRTSQVRIQVIYSVSIQHVSVSKRIIQNLNNHGACACSVYQAFLRPLPRRPGDEAYAPYNYRQLCTSMY